MNRMVRFIHAADIHLGSMLHMSGDMPAELAETIDRATYTALANLCDRAVEYDVDFLLLPGDVFDREARSVAAARFFNEQCERLAGAGIPVYMIAGNHDPLRERIGLFGLAENVHILGRDEVEVKEVKDEAGDVLARVIGRSYKNRALNIDIKSEYAVDDRGVWNIALLHTQLAPDNNPYVPCSLADLQACEHIHYWALGHIHKCRIFQQGGPVVAYPGIPQGRDFGEEGLGGSLLVELSPGQDPKIEFLPLSPVALRRVKIRIDDAQEGEPQTIPDLEELILERARQMQADGPEAPEGLDVVAGQDETLQGFVVQWILTGRGEIHHLLQEQDEEEVRQVLVANIQHRLPGETPFIWTDAVYTRTGRPLPDLGELQEASPIFREVEEVVRLASQDSEIKEELKEALGKVWEGPADHERFDETRFSLDEDVLEEIIVQARQLVVEKLVEGSELD